MRGFYFSLSPLPLSIFLFSSPEEIRRPSIWADDLYRNSNEFPSITFCSINYVSQSINRSFKKTIFLHIFFLKIGTSSVVYPAAGFAPRLAARGVPVAEFNLEETPATGAFR